MPGLGPVHQLLKFLPLHPGSHGPGLEETPIVVPGQILFTVGAHILLDDLLVEPHIMDRGHHPRHGDRRPAANREKQRPLRRTKDFAGLPLNLIECGTDTMHELVPGLGKTIDHLPAAEDLSGDDKGRRYRLVVLMQSGQIKTFVTQMNQVIGIRGQSMEKRDRFFRIIGHEQIKHPLIKHFFLDLERADNPGDKIIEMLQAEGGGNQIAEKGFRKTMNRVHPILLIPLGTILGQQVILTDLGDDNGKVILMDIGIKRINNILNPFGKSPEYIKILCIRKTLDFERAAQQQHIGIKAPGGDAVNPQGLHVEFETFDDAVKGDFSNKGEVDCLGQFFQIDIGQILQAEGEAQTVKLPFRVATIDRRNIDGDMTFVVDIFPCLKTFLGKDGLLQSLKGIQKRGQTPFRITGLQVDEQFLHLGKSFLGRLVQL